MPNWACMHPGPGPQAMTDPETISPTGAGSSKSSAKVSSEPDFFQDLRWLSVARALLVVGITLRVLQYLANRSIYRDEAALALNLRWRTWGDLLSPLDFAQASPPGHLFLLKGLVSLLGDHEYVLRFPSLIAGIATVVIFFKLAQRCLPPLGAALAVAFLALSPAAVHWSADAKQYSAGLLSTALILFLVVGNTSARVLLLAGLLSWFSEGAVFVLAGVGVALFLRRDPRAAAVVTGWALLAGASVAFGLWTTNGEVREYLQDFWQASFIQYGTLDETLTSFLILPLQAIGYPMGFAFPEMFAALLTIGWGGWYLRHRSLSGLLVAPIALTMAAAALGQYPFGGSGFGGRTILFLVPIGYLLLAGGTIAALRWKLPVGVVLAVLLLSCLSPPMKSLPHGIDNQRGLILYAVERANPGDRVYVDFFSTQVLEYYRPRWNFPSVVFIPGGCTPGAWPLSRGDLHLLQGGRVWIVESIPPDASRLSEFLAGAGHKLDGRIDPPGAVTLIDVPEELPPMPEWDRPQGRWYRPLLDCRGFHAWPEGRSFPAAGSGRKETPLWASQGVVSPGSPGR